jgi:hypothetical protein
MEIDERERLLLELADGQRKRMLACARRIVPHVTPDDLMQPNDFPDLEDHPIFRYEEGVLEGILTVCAALAACPRGVDTE